MQLNGKLIGAICCAVLLTNSALCHEGHQPLPTNGVLVDTVKGNVSLSSQARDTIGVATSEVVVGDVASTLFAYAETVAPWQAKAFGSAQISGRITQLFVRAGDTVSQNQIVATLNSRELEILRLEYLQAKQDVELNKQLLELARPSAQVGAIPMQRILEAENAFQQSEISLEMIRIRASTLGMGPRELEQLEQGSFAHAIRSPIAGKIIHSDLSEGKFVDAFEHLYDIVNNDQVWVRLQLLEKDIQKVAIGQNVELSFPERNLTIQGTIDRIDLALEPKTQVCWAWMTTSNPDILPGQVGAARIQISRTKERLCVPIGSVYSDGLQNYVFVERASTKKSAEYRKRIVQLGKQTLIANPKTSGKRSLQSSKTSEKLIEVLQGDVYPGDSVVVQGGHQLSSLFFLEVLKLSESDRSRLGIRTSRATNRPMANALKVAGSVTLPPENRSVITSQVPGTILSHSLSPGRPLRKGELLMEIAAPEFQSLQLDLLKTSLDAALFRARSIRLESIGGESVSRRLRIETLAKAEELEKRADSLRRQLSSLGLADDELATIVQDRKIMHLLPIRAAIDGNLVRWTGTLGKTIAANETLAEIQNTETFWIEAMIPVPEMYQLTESKQGKAHLLSDASVAFPVTVSRLGPTIDEVTRMQRVYLVPNELPPGVLFRDGMQLSIDLKVREGESALTVPAAAILRDGLNSFVFVQKANDYIDRRRVVTGLSDGELVEVTSGISVGEEVIVAGGRELQTAFASLR
jgi:RND family efflux transporter MFP subunit